MKRSEAIKIISDYIYELNVEPEDCDKESNLILIALEKAGMLPPMHGTQYPHHEISRLRWEEEND